MHGIPTVRNIKEKNLCREIVSKYLGPLSKIRRQTPEYPNGLDPDIFYSFAIKVQCRKNSMKNVSNSFTIKQQSRELLRKNCAKKSAKHKSYPRHMLNKVQGWFLIL